MTVAAVQPGATLTHALEYVAMGFAPIPIRLREKGPNFSKWQSLTLTDESATEYFNGTRQNIGIRLGAASGGLVDIDLDCDEARVAAQYLLPPTGCMFGRSGSRRSHRLYNVGGDAEYASFTDPQEPETLCEIRGDGGHQTVFPPSIHPSGEPIEWDSFAGEPPHVSEAELACAVRRVAASALLAKYWPGVHSKSRHNAARALSGVLIGNGWSVDDAQAFLRATAEAAGDDEVEDRARIPAHTEERLNDPAKKVSGVPTLTEYFGETIIGKAIEWLDIRHTSRPATAATDGQTVLDPQNPMKSARVFVAERHTQNGVYTIRVHQGEIFRFNGAAYERFDRADVQASIYHFTEQAVREDVDRNTGEVVRAPFKPSKHKVSEISEAMGAVVNIDSHVVAPAWLDGHDGPDPEDLLICANGALDWRTGKLHKPDPRLFVINHSPVTYNADAAEPVEWQRFLDDLWPDDGESSELLQDWFGYCLTPDTRQHKILQVVGPKRSGKGTICRILRGLLGEASVSSPMMSTLGGPFGLQPLIGTQVAIIEDARLRASTNAAAVTERLLTLSGEDSPDIARKHMPDWRGRLRTRFMLVSNELPNLGDASGAVASRFLVLRTERSFYGKEDLGLIERLRAELPGILNWAIEGRRRLETRGRFVQPTTSVADLEELAELSSPVTMFVRDRCILRQGARVGRTELFQAWLDWCRDEGRDYPGTAATFGRDLHAALPEVRDIRPKDGTSRKRAYAGIEVAYVPEM